MPDKRPLFIKQKKAESPTPPAEKIDFASSAPGQNSPAQNSSAHANSSQAGETGTIQNSPGEDRPELNSIQNSPLQNSPASGEATSGTSSARNSPAENLPQPANFAPQPTNFAPQAAENSPTPAAAASSSAQNAPAAFSAQASSSQPATAPRHADAAPEPGHVHGHSGAHEHGGEAGAKAGHPAKRGKKSEGGESMPRPRLFVAFLERGMGVKLAGLLEKFGIFNIATTTGQGTATSEILDILGLEQSGKDVVLATATARQAHAVMARLNDRLAGSGLGKGIAFTIGLSAASNLLVKAMALRQSARVTEERDRTMSNGNNENEPKYSLILLSVNQGYADEVMAAAKAAGARGGTLIRAFRTENEGTVGLFGSAFSAEREIIAVLAPKEKRNAILDAVTEEHGVRSDAAVVALALAVDAVAKLS